MNKYLRAKKFKQQAQPNYHNSWDSWDDWNPHSHSRPYPEDTNKKKFKIYCIVILILLVCTVFYALCIHFDLLGVRDWDAEDIQGQGQGQAAPRVIEPEPAAYIEHVVSSGETIWGISSRYHPNEDTRKVNWAIRAFNPGTDGERMSAKIIPGQVIRVPMDIDAVEEVKEVKEVMEATEEKDQREGVEVASRHDDSSRDYGK